MIDAALVRLTVRQLLRTKKFLMAALLSLLPLLAGSMMLIADGLDTGDGFSIQFHDPVATLVFLVTIPLVAILLAGGLVADEIEDRTLTYLLVRPLKRSSLYLSKLAPVAAIAAALAVFQVVSFAILRIIALAIHGDGTTVTVADACTDCARTMTAGSYLWRVVPAAVGIAAVLSALLVTFFGAVSLLAPRFHFFWNLGIFVLWDVSFAQTGPGIGWLTATYHAGNLLQLADVSTTAAGTTKAWFSIPWMLAWVAGWVVFGAYVIGKRDFNVTSAAT